MATTVVDVAIEGVLSELDDIFLLKEEQRMVLGPFYLISFDKSLIYELASLVVQKHLSNLLSRFL